MRSMPGCKIFEVILHLGAHRTGSTRLQAILDANRDILAEEGIVALTPPRPGNRISPTIRDVVGALPGLRQSSFKRSRKLRKARAMFLDLAAQGLRDTATRRVIVSEENLLGLAFESTGEGLYVSAYSRLSAFRQLLGRSPSKIHLTFRSYDTFLVSAYAMRAVYGEQIPPFEEIREEILAARRGWPDLVDEVARAFPGTPLKLTRIETDPVETRVQHLVGSDLFSSFRLDGEERPNVAPTVEAMAEAAEVSGRAALDDLVARHADGTRFDPLTDEGRIRLAQRYAEDAAALGL